MESDWAIDHLQVIRTLMERAAVYRRALAPVMIFNGCLGLLAAAFGLLLKFFSPDSFILFWACISLVGLSGSFVLVRRQALKVAEPFWSPPTRRIAQALTPPLLVGFAIGVAVYFNVSRGTVEPGKQHVLLSLPLSWVVLYGCALHAAGFFMPRGMKLFGWAFVFLGSIGLVFQTGFRGSPAESGHVIMAFFFGLLHLGYGVYLYFTEQRRNET